MAEDEVVDATVVAVNRGGAMCTVMGKPRSSRDQAEIITFSSHPTRSESHPIAGLRAFMPGSHYLPGKNPPEELVDSTLKVSTAAHLSDSSCSTSCGR